jgi:hypothetical protein
VIGNLECIVLKPADLSVVATKRVSYMTTVVLQYTVRGLIFGQGNNCLLILYTIVMPASGVVHTQSPWE